LRCVDFCVAAPAGPSGHVSPSGDDTGRVVGSSEISRLYSRESFGTDDTASDGGLLDVEIPSVGYDSRGTLNRTDTTGARAADSGRVDRTTSDIAVVSHAMLRRSSPMKAHSRLGGGLHDSPSTQISPSRGFVVGSMPVGGHIYESATKSVNTVASVKLNASTGVMGSATFDEWALLPCVVFTWGKGEDGQLGLSGVLTQQETPERIPRFPPMYA
jgi:Regulator of chromosome condensation (RCC1) repeat